MRRWTIVTVLVTTLVTSGCTPREGVYSAAWGQRHPSLAVIVDCTETTAYVVLDIALKGAACALSR